MPHHFRSQAFNYLRPAPLATTLRPSPSKGPSKGLSKSLKKLVPESIHSGNRNNR